jgi:hypothetical protein
MTGIYIDRDHAYALCLGSCSPQAEAVALEEALVRLEGEHASLAATNVRLVAAVDELVAEREAGTVEGEGCVWGGKGGGARGGHRGVCVCVCGGGVISGWGGGGVEVRRGVLKGGGRAHGEARGERSRE